MVFFIAGASTVCSDWTRDSREEEKEASHLHKRIRGSENILYKRVDILFRSSASFFRDFIPSLYGFSDLSQTHTKRKQTVTQQVTDFY